MANEITNTEADKAIPEIWRAEAFQARYAKQKVVGRVLNVTQDISKKGDIVNLQFFPTPTVNDVGTSGSVTNQALTLTQVQVTVDKWKEVTVDIVDKANIQSGTDLEAGFSRTIGMALGESADTELLLLHASFTGTTEVGETGSPTPLDDDNVLAAMVQLDDNNVPDEDRTWIFAPVAKSNLLKLDKFTTAEKTGMTKGVQINGQFGELYGSPVVISTLVVSTGSPAVRKNLLIHKEGLGAALQRNINIERLARVRKSTPISGDFLFGVKVVRNDHGVVLNTTA